MLKGMSTDYLQSVKDEPIFQFTKPGHQIKKNGHKESDAFGQWKASSPLHYRNKHDRKRLHQKVGAEIAGTIQFCDFPPGNARY